MVIFDFVERDSILLSTRFLITSYSILFHGNPNIFIINNALDKSSPEEN